MCSDLEKGPCGGWREEECGKVDCDGDKVNPDGNWARERWREVDPFLLSSLSWFPHVSTALTPGPCAGYSPQWWCSQIAATSTCTCTRTRKAHHPHRLLVLSCAEATRPQAEGLEASLSFYLFIYLFTYLFISVWSQEFSFYSLDYNSLYELCSLLSICILPIFIIYLS